MLTKLCYRKNVLQALLPHTKGIKRYFLLIIFFTFSNMAFDFITPLFYKLFIDKVILCKKFQLITLVLLGYLLLFLAATVIAYLKKHAEYRLVHKVLYSVKKEIFDKYVNIDFLDYDINETGDMKLRLEDDTVLIREYTSTQTIEYAISFFTMIVSGIILFTIDWRLALFSIIAIPITFALDHLVSKYEKKINNSKRENEKEMTSWLTNSLQGWREVKSLNLNHSQLRKFVKYLHIEAKYNAIWINCWTARVLVIPKIKDEFFMRFGLYFIGGLLIAFNKLTISDLLVFVMYYEMMSNAMNKVSTADAQLQANMPMTERFMEELKRTGKTTHNQAERKPCPAEFSGIDLQNVTFTYHDSQDNIIQDFTLRINPGERIAITGKSGSGKTTILKLITGMATPIKGTVCYSGIDLRDIDKNQIYEQVGFVMQENILFHTSIRENLYYGKPNATNEEMAEACKRACILQFIKTLPNGFDTIIGEKGIKLSGGQRQRLILARLFLRNVSVYIFDEATSALDKENEEMIQEMINNLGCKKTIIVVAHRESSIKLCDRIVQIT